MASTIDMARTVPQPHVNRNHLSTSITTFSRTRCGIVAQRVHENDGEVVLRRGPTLAARRRPDRVGRSGPPWPDRSRLVAPSRHRCPRGRDRRGTTGARPDNRCDDAPERPEPAFDLADVVQDRAGDLGPCRIGSALHESTSNCGAVSSILIRQLYPQPAFTGQQVFVDPHLVSTEGGVGRNDVTNRATRCHTFVTGLALLIEPVWPEDAPSGTRPTGAPG